MKKSLKIQLIFVLTFMFSVISLSAQQTIAVLPFTFTDNGNYAPDEGKNAQQFLIQYILKKQKHFNVSPLNARSINVALHKAGITPENIDNFTIKEINEYLKADYILIGSIDKTLAGSSSTSGGFDTKTHNGKYNNTIHTNSSSTSNQYKADVYISIFKADGTPVFDKSKGNVFIDQTPDSWKNSILWLVRHFPFYK